MPKIKKGDTRKTEAQIVISLADAEDAESFMLTLMLFLRRAKEDLSGCGYMFYQSNLTTQPLQCGCISEAGHEINITAVDLVLERNRIEA